MTKTSVIFRTRLIAGFLLVSVAACYAQTDGYLTNSNMRGPAPGNTFQTTNIDYINLANGALNLRIPLFSHKGRGLDAGAQINYSSKFWVVRPIYDTYFPTQIDAIYWDRTSPLGYAVPLGFSVSDANLGLINHDEQIIGCQISDDPPTYSSQTNHYNFTYQGVDGETYRFPNAHEEDTLGSCGSVTIINQGVSDNGAMLLDTTQHPYTLYNKNGSKECEWWGPCTLRLTDSNGNQTNNGIATLPITTDTLERTYSWNSNTYSQPILSVKNSNGATQTYNFQFSSGSNGSTQFPTTSCGVPVIQGGSPGAGAYTTLTLPNGSSYRFEYDPNFGEINKIILPTGGYIRYEYVTLPTYDNPPAFLSSCNGLDSRRVSGRFVSPTGLAQDEQPWHYSYNRPTTTVTDPLGNVTVHTFPVIAGYDDQQTHETSTQYYSGSSTLLRTITTAWAFNSGPGLTDAFGNTDSSSQDWRITSTTTTEGNQVKRGESDYDSYTYTFQGSPYTASRGNVITQREYAWGSGAPGGLLRRTSFSYLHDLNANYLNVHILDRVAQTTIFDGSGNVVAQTQYEYDNYTQGISYSGATQHDSSYNTGYTLRGNQTARLEWLNTNGSWLTTRNQYDDAGNVTQTTDPVGHTTSFSYADSWANNSCTPSGGNGAAYVTSVTNALNHVARAQYNSCSGSIGSITDANNQTTSYSYESMERVSSIVHPDIDSCGNHGETDFLYTDTPPSFSVQRSRRQRCNTWINDFNNYDGLNRVVRTRLVDPEGDDYTDTTYDALGRVYSVSNPYRSGVSSSTDGTTYFGYDALGRQTQITRQDGNTVQTDYSAFPTVVVTDETGRRRQSTTDALGRITQVVEPNPSTGSLTSGSYPTYYSYDALGNLTYVNQVGDGSAPRTRWFTNDSLSRLLNAYNPESGNTTFSYDADSNLISKTDARGLTVNYGYDALHRLGIKTYTDGSSPREFYYDQANHGSSVGRLTHASNDVNAAYDPTYDSMGRITNESYCIPSNCSYSLSTQAQYDLAGNLTSLTYPSGRKITESYNAAGHLLNVNFERFSGTYVNYPYFTAYQSASSNPGYHPTGALRLSYDGNNVWNYENFNSRLQPIQQVSQASLPGSPYLINRAYSYSEANFNNYNAGNVASIVDGLNAARNQAYAYDWLKRLTSASEADASFNQTLSPDPWGNLKQFGTAAFSPNFDSNNRISQVGYNYDSAGNLLSDTFHNYAYDAESRIKNVDTNGAAYTYDADGNRVRKDVGSDATEYIYFRGQPIAEYKPTTGDWSDYIYANGKRIAKADTYENAIRTFGTNCSNCGSQDSLFAFSQPAGGWNWTIRSGDKLWLRQWQSAGARGGIFFKFTDGTYSAWSVNDADGYLTNDDGVIQQWHNRSIDLSSFQGKIIQDIILNASPDTAAGSWSIYYDDISVSASDGTVLPVFTGESSATFWQIWGTAGVSGRGYEVNHDPTLALVPGLTTRYYHEDHLGTSRLMISAGGWPIWQGTFLPFGQEWNPQITTNHYKFTGKERDSESGAPGNGLDYFGARYYSSSMGRWMSPDWADKPEPVPYAELADPQSLNLYGYVRNNPTSKADVDGHSPEWWQKFTNCLQYLKCVTDKNLNEALRHKAGVDMRQMQKEEVFFKGKPIEEALRGKSFKEVVDFYNQYQHDKMLGMVPAIAPLYRGGSASMEARPGIDVRIDKSTGLVKPGHGPSLNEDPTALIERFGSAHEIDPTTVPPELEIKQVGRPGHYELVSKEPMTLERFNELANQVKPK